MKAFTILSSLVLLTSTLAAPVPRVNRRQVSVDAAASGSGSAPADPAATPAAKASGEPSVIGVSIIGSTTIAGAAASDFANAAAAAASATPAADPAAASASAGGEAGAASDSAAAGGDASASAEAPPPAESSAAAPPPEGEAPPPPPEASAAPPPPAGGEAPPPADDGAAAAAAQDLTVLNLALVLEELETSFYKTGLETFSKSEMVKAGLTSAQADIITQTLTSQFTDEGTHAKTITQTITALGGKPASGACQFDFSSVMTNVPTFIAAARTLELVGVAAYAGAANLISNPNVLTAAATILSIESRHQSGLNLFAGGTFTPQAFDFALRPEQVLALSGAFLKGCKAEDLGLSANMPLSAVDTKSGTTLISQKTQLAFASPMLDSKTDASKLTCQMLVTGQPTAIVMPLAECVVPPGVNGPVMVYVSNDTTPLQSNIIQQNAAQIMAGPAALFIDDSSQSFQQLFSVQGFGISQIASIDMGSILMNGADKKVDIMDESKKGKQMKEQVENGIVAKNRKRGFVSEGAKILGWNN